jgi:hypothetical protein
MTLGPQFSLYHGTGGGIVGDVRPGERGYGAYATSDLKVAERYAANKALSEGRLFGSVYSVTPVSEYVEQETEGAGYDPVGLEAEEIVSFPKAR